MAWIISNEQFKKLRKRFRTGKWSKLVTEDNMIIRCRMYIFEFNKHTRRLRIEAENACAVYSVVARVERPRISLREINERIDRAERIVHDWLVYDSIGYHDMIILTKVTKWLSRETKCSIDQIFNELKETANAAIASQVAAQA